MGYDTSFGGAFQFNKEVTPQLKEYINRFSATRRMPRDNDKIKEIYPNWRELCFFGELGNKGEYFAPMSGNYGQENDASILDYNGFRGAVHPGLWCQWVINDNNELVWDEGEKFYSYVEWLEYLIKHFFAPNGYVLNGEVSFQGEEYDDFGIITVTDNVVDISYGERIMSLSDIDDYKLINELKSRGYVVNQ
jgi:hypothetical protein